MSVNTSNQTGDRYRQNRLLAALPPEDLELLLQQGEIVSLEHGHYAIVPGEPIHNVYFPLNCLLSLVTTMEDGSSAESGSIGREGMSGIPIILGASQTTMPTFVQVPGEAFRVRSRVVKALYDGHAATRDVLNRYIHTVVVVGSQSTACNALHRVEARMSKWLLMSSDGVGSDEVQLTHEYLAVMLGVRRAGVTEVAGRLRAEGLIDNVRGCFKILNREALERAACECYRMAKGEYERLFGSYAQQITQG